MTWSRSVSEQNSSDIQAHILSIDSVVRGRTTEVWVVKHGGSLPVVQRSSMCLRRQQDASMAFNKSTFFFFFWPHIPAWLFNVRHPEQQTKQRRGQVQKLFSYGAENKNDFLETQYNRLPWLVPTAGKHRLEGNFLCTSEKGATTGLIFIFISIFGIFLEGQPNHKLSRAQGHCGTEMATTVSWG